MDFSISTVKMGSCYGPPCYTLKLSFPIFVYPLPQLPNRSFIIHAKKNPQSEPILKPSIVQEVSAVVEEEEELLFDDFEDEALMGADDSFEDEYVDEEAELYEGDGGGGGGISLAGTWWDKTALELAEEVCLSFDGDLQIYAFKTLPNSTIKVRIEKLSNKSGSPSMTDIELFSAAYRARLDEAELATSIPDNISLEVSSPGLERVVRVPQELDRFKDRNMYVRYATEGAENGSNTETDGIFRLISLDLETNSCTWGIADVRVNREKAGKGRPLSKKQREWRLETPIDSLRLVRLYSDL